MRLLIVDDSRSLRSILRSVLRPLAQDVEIVEAADGLEAVEACGRGAFDLVFMDVNMPRMNGIDALAGIKTMNPTARIVMLTAIEDEATVREARALGADGYVTKPFTARDIQDVVDGLLAARRLRVLVAAGSPQVRGICRRTLAQLDARCEIVETADGEEALRRYQEQPFDLVLLDTHMPNLDGMAALQRIKAADPRAYVVVLSADRSAGAVASAVSAGASEYLLKPFTIEQLAAVVERAQARRGG